MGRFSPPKLLRPGQTPEFRVEAGIVDILLVDRIRVNNSKYDLPFSE